MIVSDLFNDKSTGNNPAITTELKLKSFFSKLYELPDNKTYPFKRSDSNETGIDTYFPDIYDDMNLVNDKTHILPLKEEEISEEDLLAPYIHSRIKPKKEQIFKVNYRIRYDSFDEKENASISDKKAFLEDEVLPKIKRRRENRDNICKKIKTVFFNKYLYTKINEALKNKLSKLYFLKFPITFVNDIKKDMNKDLLNKTLLQIILSKEIYNEKDLNNYYHNLKVVENKEIQENEELMKILNKKYCELFEEYIDSKEFNIDEIKRLKNNNMDNIYIERYIYQTKNFINFFAE